jgi:hypothetical protein
MFALLSGAFRSIADELQAMTNMYGVFPPSEAARFCGLSPSTLAKLRLGGNGPNYCKLGRRVVYRPDDLAAWLETRIARDTADADARLPKSLAAPAASGDGR